MSVDPMIALDHPDIRISLDFDREKDVVAADLTPPSSFAPFRGHFPGNPILPGIAQISLVTEILSRALSPDIRLDAVRRVKYLSPVYPEMPLHFDLTLRRGEGFLLADVTIRSGDTRISVLKLRYSGVSV